MHIRTLTYGECCHLLSTGRLAHLACMAGEKPYVVPIYFAYSGNHLYAFSLPGRKIDLMRANPHISVVIEQWMQGREWRSVIVEGRYQEIENDEEHEAEQQHAWQILSKHFDWWEPGALKPEARPIAHCSDHIFFRIFVDHLTGREATEV
ncbi:pyridoxamine 5'-phosphate oxidase family protein [Brucella anthropi]|uniref:Pyridoxamine 5'-phosphate oxidase family protein n=1 Tax=Brucella anthropi TaxID=529 RepID=A0A6I0DQS8_BRUAN|nr:pyridoxamine 5'-phosphate oxidase family protein [Brucella anthropi]KAB2797275.1 pyridoxamine 5'-phosphate oxidase family protein [Brucella anthropi]